MEKIITHHHYYYYYYYYSQHGGSSHGLRIPGQTLPSTGNEAHFLYPSIHKGSVMDASMRVKGKCQPSEHTRDGVYV